MDLHTGVLYWPQTLPAPPAYPSLQEDIECDILVIGGGEAGALISHELMKFRFNTVLVEKRTISGGISRANTGILQYANDLHLNACIDTLGEQKGLRIYQLCRQALDELEGIIAGLDLDCEFQRRSSLYLASSHSDVPELRQEFHTLQDNGFDVTYLEKGQIAASFSFSKPGAICYKNDAEVNPFRLTHALIHQARQHGIRVYEYTEVISHTSEQDRLVFKTKQQHQIKARFAVFATGYETQSIKRNPGAVLSSSFAIATQPLKEFPGWPGRCLIWETARPYLFIRTTADNRIIAGGLDEATVNTAERDAKLEGKKNSLLHEVRQLFPGIPDLQAEYYWAATFGSTHDGLPMFGVQEGFPNCYFITGYCGNGTVYNRVAAKIISGMLIHGSHPDAELFRFDRRTLTPSVNEKE
ncbi:NAD(P)/FAD-dependent oxidoreductase [Paenibacillus sedimenti]|uniref:FAD-dependent oxidoreductase n=1 Tax=Paenibacillus sedimenti TaxID=2770274 RepID=A0A926KMP0_9BACL|nr:FAD-dependent oxidoreductase [Paenibacillus sedimenti]MBD0380657.1 FAD-dependent oxidoreductase [Paenibacillus sedimenti]